MRVHADYWRADQVTIAEAVAIEIVALGETLQGHPGAARSVARLGTLGDRLQSPLHVGLASLFDAVAAMQAGDPDRAADACRTALETWHGHRYDVQILEALDVLAWASAAGGQAETAGRLLATTTESRRQRGWAVAAYEEQWQSIGPQRRDRHRRVPRRRTLGVRADRRRGRCSGDQLSRSPPPPAGRLAQPHPDRTGGGRARRRGPVQP